jgi:cardiolipin synthase A/B
MLADIEAAQTSVHINQFGFRPGVVGDRFADALIRKAKEASPCASWSTGRALRPRRRRASTTSGLLRPASKSASSAEVGSQGARGRRRPEVEPLLGHIDHRKVVLVDGRIGWVGGAGIEDHFQDGRFHDLFLRVTGPVVSHLQLVFVASLRWLGGEIPAEELDDLFPEGDAGEIPAVVLHNAPGKYRPITDQIARMLDGSAPAEAVSRPGSALAGFKPCAKATAFAVLSPLL